MASKYGGRAERGGSGSARAPLLSHAVAGAALAALLALLVLAVGLRSTGTAEAQGGRETRALIDSTVSAAESKWHSCFERELAGSDAAASVPVTAPGFGMVQARLEAAAGDWDLAVFDTRSGRLVAASAFRGSTEVAEGYVAEGQELLLQACRLSGPSAEADVSASLIPVPRAQVGRSSLAEVRTPTRRSKSELTSLGLDLTEHGGRNFVAVVLHGRADREALEHAGFEYEVLVGDLANQAERNEDADTAFAAGRTRTALPSGRDGYRRLADYSQEMKDLASEHPDLVRPFTLPNETWEGRPVEGIEITTDPGNLRDGKPVFLQLGVHHAREWPSGEHAMEWAYDLINGYEAGDQRVRRLVQSVRTIVVPIVNPDGFNASREAGELQGGSGGRGGDDLVNIATHPNEYRRKNCRVIGDPAAGTCTQPSGGLAEPGVDPNRNYGAFWGGPGASSDPTAQDYRGPGPFSEPETQNIRALVSARQVTTLITNHTYSNLVLRPPGLASQGDVVDEALLKGLGDAMAAENGYASQQGWQLYDTSGTTEDWSYSATGGFGYTFEIGCQPNDSGDCIGNFHPPFEQVVAHYEGTNPEAQALGGSGNREAYFLAMENTADASKHALLRGQARPGAVIELDKSFQTPTSPVIQADGSAGEEILLDDSLHSEIVVPPSGQFEWHINPSTRPLVAKDRGRVADGAPSDAVSFSGDPSTTVPCADFETDDETCWNDHPFTIPGGAGIDNDKATVSIEWPSPASDWDMKIFRDVDGDGTSVNETADDEVGQSARGQTSSESTTFTNPEGTDGKLVPGEYVIRAVNFAAVEPYEGSVTFAGPDEFVPAETESWTLSCKRGKRTIREEITIARGEAQELDLSMCQPPAKRRCGGARATIASSEPGARLVGTPGDDVIKAGKGRNVIRGRGGDDVVCGGRGNDVLRDGGGDDRLIGGRGRDRVRGGKGKDMLSAGRHRDRLDGGKGRDKLRGGAGRDRLNGGKARDNCRGGKARDKLKSCERGRE